jgi:hypothetical protein
VPGRGEAEAIAEAKRFFQTENRWSWQSHGAGFRRE